MNELVRAPRRRRHSLTSLPLLSFFTAIGLARAAEFEMRDEVEFKTIVPPDAKLAKLATGMKFTEGPVWMAREGGYLVFSDIPADELKKWTAKNGLAVFRQPSSNANGNTLDRQGRLVSCEHTGRRVSRREAEGSWQTVVDQCDGKKFNSPNDVVVKSDGTIWFTDPPYGLPRGATKEQDGNYVFRFDPKAKVTTIVVKDFDMPNGLCFSPDEMKLYIADSGKPHHIRVFDVQKDGTLTGGAVFCVIDKGGPDGIRCDAQGRIFSSAGDGVHIFAPDGKLIGKILVPETPANLCFGGPDGKNAFHYRAHVALFDSVVGQRREVRVMEAELTIASLGLAARKKAAATIVAADVRRRTATETPTPCPPPHVDGYTP